MRKSRCIKKLKNPTPLSKGPRRPTRIASGKYPTRAKHISMKRR